MIFRRGGGSDCPSEVEFLESGNCFDAYEYIAYILCFVVRSENETYIVHIAYKLQLNMCVLLCPKLQNRPKKKIKTGMG